jgi:hypothetical protein
VNACYAGERHHFAREPVEEGTPDEERRPPELLGALGQIPR